jgi:hypothetical protein
VSLSSYQISQSVGYALPKIADTFDCLMANLQSGERRNQIDVRPD